MMDICMCTLSLVERNRGLVYVAHILTAYNTHPHTLSCLLNMTLPLRPTQKYKEQCQTPYFNLLILQTKNLFIGKKRKEKIRKKQWKHTSNGKTQTLYFNACLNSCFKFQPFCLLVLANKSIANHACLNLAIHRLYD